MYGSYFNLMLPKITERSLAYISLISAVVIWGVATPVIKVTLGAIPPFTFLMLRFLFSAIITLPATIYYFRKIKISGDRLRKILTAGSIGNILALILIFTGLSLTTSVNGSIITSFSPLIVTIMGFFILREHITRKEIEGTLLAFIGTLVIVFEPIFLSSYTSQNIRYALIGNFIFLAGMIVDGYYSIYVKQHLSHDKLVTPIMHVFISFLFAAIIFIPLSAAEQFYAYRQTESGTLRMCTSKDIDKYNYSTGVICNAKGCYPTKQKNEYFCLSEHNKVHFSKYLLDNYSSYLNSTYALLGVLYMAIFSGLAAYSLYNIGLKRIEASEAAVFYYLQPLFGIPVGMFLLNEKISLVFAVGAAIIITGIYMVEKK